MDLLVAAAPEVEPGNVASARWPLHFPSVYPPKLCLPDWPTFPALPGGAMPTNRREASTL